MSAVHGLILTGELHAVKFRDDVTQFGDIQLRMKGRLNGVSISVRRDKAEALASVPEGSVVDLLVSIPYLATSKAGARYMSWYLIDVLGAESATPSLPSKPVI